MCFKNKILPLLQEYFYGDYGKIGCIIGEKFFHENISSNNSELIRFRSYDIDSFLDKPILKLKDIDKMSETEFLDALNTLLKVE